jgi:hypothetical protein
MVRILAICPKIRPAGKKIKKFVVSRNLHHAHHLEVGLMKIMGDHETLSIVCHVGLFIHEVFFGPLGIHLHV